jgi:hypothetical protein
MAVDQLALVQWQLAISPHDLVIALVLARPATTNANLNGSWS